MKRKTRKTNKTLNITADRAAHVLHILIAEGKLTAKHVSDALKRREQLIHELRQRLEALERGAVSAVERVGRKITRKAGRKPKRRMTATRRAALKLHGRYLGHVRMLPKAAKAKIKKVRETKGVHAAIKAARKMTKPAATAAKARRSVKATRPNYRSRSSESSLDISKGSDPSRTGTAQVRADSRGHRAQAASAAS